MSILQLNHFHTKFQLTNEWLQRTTLHFLPHVITSMNRWEPTHKHTLIYHVQAKACPRKQLT